jgi:hypothetical protein
MVEARNFAGWAVASVGMITGVSSVIQRRGNNTARILFVGRLRIDYPSNQWAWLVASHGLYGRPNELS